MSYDHSPSQTYLRRFCSIDKAGYVNVYRKPRATDPFYTLPKGICSEKNGDNNNSFQNSLILREFLSPIEQQWPKVIKNLKERKIHGGTLGAVDGYLAYLRLCSPVAKRLNQQVMAEDLKNIALCEANSINSTLGNVESFFADGGGITIDRDFANAPAIMNLPLLTLAFSKSDHFILYNDTDIPFLTSDNPAISLLGLTYCPLTPRISVLLIPPNPVEVSNITSLSLQEEDFYNVTTRYSFLNIKDVRVQEYNREIVKFAKDKVISNIRAPWITELVQEFKHYRTELICTKEGEFYKYKQQAERV